MHTPSISDHSLIERRLPVQPVTVFDLFSVHTWGKFVDHSILLTRLEINVGMQGSVLEWFLSYLTGICRFIMLLLCLCFLSMVCPQGSVLGPV